MPPSHVSLCGGCYAIYALCARINFWPRMASSIQYLIMALMGDYTLSGSTGIFHDTADPRNGSKLACRQNEIFNSISQSNSAPIRSIQRRRRFDLLECVSRPPHPSPLPSRSAHQETRSIVRPTIHGFQHTPFPRYARWTLIYPAIRRTGAIPTRKPAQQAGSTCVRRKIKEGGENNQLLMVGRNSPGDPPEGVFTFSLRSRLRCLDKCR